MSHIEDGLLRVLQALLPAAVKQVTILADRGFGDVDLYDHIRELGFDFVIRFRGGIFVTSNGAPSFRVPLAWWLSSNALPSTATSSTSTPIPGVRNPSLPLRRKPSSGHGSRVRSTRILVAVYNSGSRS